MESISIQYPSWYIFLCVALALAYAFIVYWRSNRHADFPKWLVILLGVLRFSSVGIISFFLLSPLVKTVENEVISPKIILLQDESESILLGSSQEDLAETKNVISAVSNVLGEENELIKLGFGQSTRVSTDTVQYKDKATNISDALKYVDEVYGHENIGAILLFSDGIYNQGINPIYQNLQLKSPLYTIGQGDTTKRKDLSIKNVFHNKIAYLDDKFEIQVDLQAYQASNKRSSLTISKVINGKTIKLERRAIKIDNNNYFSTEDFIIDAQTSGINQYRISFSPLKDESISSNNYKDIFVEVLDTKQRVLLLADAPHPDIAAFRSVLESNKNTQVDVISAEDKGDIKTKYDLVLLHNLPSKKHPIDGFLKSTWARNASLVYVVGTRTNLASFNTLQNVLTINARSSIENEVQASVNTNFNLFNMDDKLKSSINAYPPLDAPFGEYNLGLNSEVLAYQEIKKIKTKYPLIAFGEKNKKKIAVITANGIFKWKLFDYLQNDNHNQVNELINKIISYTTIKDDKRKFRVTSNKRVYNENENILFDAELYNESYERINEPEISLQIKNNEGKVFEYSFSRKSDYYFLDAGLFPMGNYSYVATTNYRAKTLTQKGKFIVKQIQLEAYNLTADHNLLHSLSKKYNGKFYNLSSANDLIRELDKTAALKPILFENNSTRSLINLKWIFWLILFLLALEWFLRRYYGTY